MKFILKISLFSMFLCPSLVADAQRWHKEPLKSKVEEQLTKHFDDAQNFQLKEMGINTLLLSIDQDTLNGELFQLSMSNSPDRRSYAYIGRAPSMKNVFDYMIIFDQSFSIEKARVLIYREQHGRQIGSPRWLNQFKGLTYLDQPKVNNDIDGISGATISVTNMTKDIAKVLRSIGRLKQTNYLLSMYD
jgi:hypothetical protein